MSYNGIGLSTPRGSATSGHIQSNISNRAFQSANRRGEFEHQELTDEQDKRSKTKLDRDYAAGRQADVEMLEHERKRKVEVACMELQDKLEEEGEKGEEEIEEEVNTLRRQLTLKMARELDVRTTIVSADREALRKNYHKAAVTKQQEMDRMRDAFDTTRNMDDRGRDRPRNRERQNRDKSPVRDAARRSRSARERSPSRRGRRPRRYSVNEEVRTTEVISERQGSGSPCQRADSRSRSRSPERRSRRKSYRERSRSRSRERSERRERRGSVREKERGRSLSPLPY